MNVGVFGFIVTDDAVDDGAIDAVALLRFNGTYPTRYKLIKQKGSIDAALAELLSNPEDTSVVSAEDALSDLSRLRAGSRVAKMAFRDFVVFRS